jgi:6,7-dimethyl-8-ribityllumazine synthase
MEIQKNTKEIRIDGSKMKIGIILPYFNEEIGLTLLKNAIEELKKNKIKDKNIIVKRVAGALEIPFACKKMAKKEKPNAIITLGIIIKGETSHYDLVCQNTYSGIMSVQLSENIPITFGVLTCQNIKQAKIRAGKKGLNKGKKVAQAAILQTLL